VKEIIVLLSCAVAVRADEFHERKLAGIKAPTYAALYNEMESSPDFWRTKAQNLLKSTLNAKENLNKAKNVIFFIGDGMSIPTIAATRAHMGKEENELSFEKFPNFGYAQTYCVDAQVPDSACTATAYLGGVKTRRKAIGVNANVKISQCQINEEDHVDSIALWAQKAEKATGIVTTTRITHASPAGIFAHTSHRDWENDSNIPEACANVTTNRVRDIGRQLVENEVSRNLKVVLGGGRKNLIPKTEKDEEGRPGLRNDGRNIIDEWIKDKSGKGKAKYIWHKQQLDEIDVDNTDYLMGLFENDHCMFNLDIENNNLQNQEPSLTDMTAKAIKMLQKEEKGFFLFVEGGRIDMAHHENQPLKSLEDTREFARAIDVARQMTNEANTLIVVSSDHSHAFTFSGYTNRGQDVVGIAEISDEDGKPYEVLSYANGPGYPTTYDDDTRVDISLHDFKNPERRNAATVPLLSETHGGDDIGVYASGPWSHLFAGSYEQNNLPLLMSYAMKIGEYSEVKGKNSSATNSVSKIVLLISVIFVLILVVVSANKTFM
jgi:alkaline phosphatase